QPARDGGTLDLAGAGGGHPVGLGRVPDPGSVLLGGTQWVQWVWGESLVQSGVLRGGTQWVWGDPGPGSVLLGGTHGGPGGRGPAHPTNPLPAGAALVPPGCPYWPGEFVTTASESEGVAGTEGLRVQPAGGAGGPPRGDPLRPNGEALPREPLLLPLPHPHKGILKKKCLPPISERGGSAQRPGPPPPPPAGTAASSGSDGGPPPAPRARQSLEEQLSGLTPIAMSIRAGTADEDSSGSE
ncbi:LOW QUALITY PROTEIN: cadherin EGF LAG seven-pass G-type receptor 2-like, partial [Neopelma chrysocephalum]|uniref:LOW QUALITY PROTEIN: cadherin EGF LAG seven-pass G-type receptor 2-like n=1 Tax=Neopelma chrysocephalum TaxID=114329 RepID=UPI000FCD1639